MASKIEEKRLDSRDLPDTVDYYTISNQGIVEPCAVAKATVYIDEMDVRYFEDTDTMLYIRETYGPNIGVMRDYKFAVRPRERRTRKMLLGVVNVG